jgi:hypothetical protein
MSAATCLACGMALKPQMHAVSCGACGSIHHPHCWAAGGGCAMPGCVSERRRSRSRAWLAVVPIMLAVVGALAYMVTDRVLAARDSAPADRAVRADDGSGGGAPPPPPVPTAMATPLGRQTPRVIRFHTGRDGGQALPAAYCEMRRRSVYCWTPNDGFTLGLSNAGARRLRSDEAFNEGRAPARHARLALGRSRSLAGFECESAPAGLRCVNRDGHGWSLPRYVGLPSLF